MHLQKNPVPNNNTRSFPDKEVSVKRSRVQETIVSSRFFVLPSRVRVRHSVAAEKLSVEENSEGSWVVEALKTLFHVCNCKRTLINPFIPSRTLYFCYAYPPTHDNILGWRWDDIDFGLETMLNYLIKILYLLQHQLTVSLWMSHQTV